MPTIWTNMLFCEDIIDSITSPSPFMQYEAYMKFGSQGPNPFIYYHLWPWKHHDKTNKVGKMMAAEHCEDFLMDLIIAAQDKGKKVQAYIFGFVAHHILMQHTRAYIHFHAQKHHLPQQKLETLIDTVMMEKFHNLKVWKVPAYKEMDVGYSLNKDIVQTLHAAIAKNYPDLTGHSSHYIQKAYRDTKLSLKWLKDPYGWKRALFKSPMSMLSHQPISDGIDYLNLNNHTWFDHLTGQSSFKSFIDLYEKGRAKAIGILTKILQYWQQQDHIHTQEIANFIYGLQLTCHHISNMQANPKYEPSIVQ